MEFRTNAQRDADHRKLDPKGRVPALATERGVLTERPALLAVIAQSFPEAKLASLDDAYAFAREQDFNSYPAAQGRRSPAENA